MALCVLVSIFGKKHYLLVWLSDRAQANAAKASLIPQLVVEAIMDFERVVFACVRRSDFSRLTPGGWGRKEHERSPALSMDPGHRFDDGALALVEAKGQVLVFDARLENLRPQAGLCWGHR